MTSLIVFHYMPINLRFRDKCIVFGEEVTSRLLSILCLLKIRLMPNMNGFELFDKLRELDSNVKTCFLTAASEIYYEDVIKDAFPELDI
jgi:hypothetical protein